jgi:hypothetical protein
MYISYKEHNDDIIHRMGIIFFLIETGGETPTDYILKKNNLSTA